MANGLVTRTKDESASVLPSHNGNLKHGSPENRYLLSRLPQRDWVLDRREYRGYRTPSTQTEGRWRCCARAFDWILLSSSSPWPPQVCPRSPPPSGGRKRLPISMRPTTPRHQRWAMCCSSGVPPSSTGIW